MKTYILIDSVGSKYHLDKVFAPKSKFIILHDSSEYHTSSDSIIDKINIKDTTSFFELKECISNIRKMHCIEKIICLSEKEKLVTASLNVHFGFCDLNSYSTALRVRDKFVMKEHAKLSGINIPGFSDIFGAYRLLEQHKKIIIKPRLGFGSVDTFVVESINELNCLINKHSISARLCDFICEEFIEGSLHHYDAIVKDGKPIEGRVSIYSGSTIDFSNKDYLYSYQLIDHAAERFCESIISAYSILNGVVHIEFFKTNNSEYVFCEIATRAGGGGIVPGYEATTGYNLFVSDLLLGTCSELERNDEVFSYSGQLIFYSKSGVINKISKVEDFCEEYLWYKSIRKSNGDYIRKSNYSADKIATFVITADSPELVEHRIQELIKNFKCEIVND